MLSQVVQNTSRLEQENTQKADNFLSSCLEVRFAKYVTQLQLQICLSKAKFG
jgi:hypothetical protein